MKTSDITYYTDQINSFTAGMAIEKKNAISVTFPNGKTKWCKTEERADIAYKKCSKTS